MNDDCPTTHGHYRCKYPRGHSGNCEADDQSRCEIALGPYRDQFRTVAYVRGIIDFSSGEMLDFVGKHVRCARLAREDDCAYRARLTRALP